MRENFLKVVIIGLRGKFRLVQLVEVEEPFLFYAKGLLLIEVVCGPQTTVGGENFLKVVIVGLRGKFRLGGTGEEIKGIVMHLLRLRNLFCFMQRVFIS